MTQNHTSKNEESISDLYLQVWRSMYFGSLIYWGNFALANQKNMWARQGSLDADLQASQNNSSE